MQVKFKSIHIQGMLESDMPLEAEVEFAEPTKVVNELGGNNDLIAEANERATKAEELVKEAVERADQAETELTAELTAKDTAINDLAAYKEVVNSYVTNVEATFQSNGLPLLHPPV